MFFISIFPMLRVHLALSVLTCSPTYYMDVISTDLFHMEQL